jgi:3-oxoacyl-[acyl-carrier protein] reductase
MSARVALITGGASGIGLGISRQLAGEGWRLALNGSREESLVDPILTELRKQGGEAIYLRGDISDASSRSTMVVGTISAFGRIDALVNNAGVTSPGRLEFLDATEESFDRVLDINLKAPYFLAQLVAREMAQQHQADPTCRGTIINITSVSASVVSVNRGDYCVSKAGLSMATKVMAASLGQHGIDCFEIRPGLILTEMTSPVKGKYDALIAQGLLVEPRWGTPEDLGAVVATLLRGDLPYSTGQILSVDGGMSIQTL